MGLGRGLVNHHWDAILMLDDAAQRIYPGGFRPVWANLNFSGHSDTLDVNFRNTRRIFRAARAVRGEVVVSRDANDGGSVDAVSFEGDEGDRPILNVAKREETREVPSRPDRRPRRERGVRAQRHRRAGPAEQGRREAGRRAEAAGHPLRHPEGPA